MVKYALFLKWWLVMVLVAVGTIFCYYGGVFADVWQKDNSYLSWVILALFYFMSFCCGALTWNVSKVVSGEVEYNQSVKDEFGRYEQLGWFSSEQCLTLGMIGTVWGFVTMLPSFGSVNVGDTSSIQGLIKYLGSGMATALYTTLVGLICGMLLKVQYFNISHAIDNTSIKVCNKTTTKCQEASISDNEVLSQEDNNESKI